MPRIVNIYNFIRAIEPRDAETTPDVLWQTTANQIRQLKQYGLPATFALQYDALIEPRYQKLLKEELDDRDEIAAWWEIVQPQVEKAGLRWRGRYPWDWHAHVGFSTGYTPREREKLVDVYMAEFKKVFGKYPRTVGSWFIDEHSLAYMAGQYGIIASCNCKDQIGTDGYTMWGGYWNQAYYPSRKNSYMPAQNAKNQIPVPVFRMLGSDPIYQYDLGLGTDSQGVVSLEPVYSEGGGGGDSKWVRWFFDILVNEPYLGFAYTQAGQENSFRWKNMAKGLGIQIPLIAKLAKNGKIKVETLEQSGKWFRSKYKVTPATSFSATKDWKKEGRKTVWYNSRFYRANLLWEKDGFRVRDIHLFNEKYTSLYLAKPLTSSKCDYDTLPVMDGFHWSSKTQKAGIRLVEIKPDGKRRVVKVGDPKISQSGQERLNVRCPVEKGGELLMSFDEAVMQCTLKGISEWGLEFAWSPDRNRPPIRKVKDCAIVYKYKGFPYLLKCKAGYFKSIDKNGVLILPEKSNISLSMRADGFVGKCK